jgi:hypothetical protein
MLKNQKGPTDKAIRDFRDTFDEKRRHKKLNKRERRKTKEKLDGLKGDISPLEGEDEELFDYDQT